MGTEFVRIDFLENSAIFTEDMIERKGSWSNFQLSLKEFL